MRTVLVIAAAAAMSLAAGAAAQEVRTFIDPAKTTETPKYNSDADREFVIAFAKGWGVNANDKGELPMCQYRSPLKTAGGYVDADPYRFYMRVPFPRSRTTMTNVRLAGRKEFADVAYLEVWGHKDLRDRTKMEHKFRIIVPPLSPTDPNRPLTTAVVRTGSFGVRQAMLLYGPPGVPSQIELSENGPLILSGLRSSPIVSARISRMEPITASASAYEVSADFGPLLGDIDRVTAYMDQMYARKEAKNCDVFTRECYDGQCG